MTCTCTYLLKKDMDKKIYMDYSRPSKYITYQDANNLYGWTMSQYLPYSGFKWLNWKEIEKTDVNSISEHGSDGYILEVDLKYPDELHDLHNYYPLPPENFEISHNILSNYCRILQVKFVVLIN